MTHCSACHSILFSLKYKMMGFKVILSIFILQIFGSFVLAQNNSMELSSSTHLKNFRSSMLMVQFNGTSYSSLELGWVPRFDLTSGFYLSPQILTSYLMTNQQDKYFTYAGDIMFGFTDDVQAEDRFKVEIGGGWQIWKSTPEWSFSNFVVNILYPVKMKSNRFSYVAGYVFGYAKPQIANFKLGLQVMF